MKYQVRLPRPSRAEATLLPAVLGGSLALMAALQFALPVEDELPVSTAATVRRLVAPLETSRAVADPVILANALFSPARIGKQSDAKSDTGPMDGARVVGSVQTRGFARALLQTSDGSAVTVAVGGRYRGWRLIGLNPTNAIFRRGGVTLPMPFGAGAVVQNNNYENGRVEEQ